MACYARARAGCTSSRACVKDSTTGKMISQMSTIIWRATLMPHATPRKDANGTLSRRSHALPLMSYDAAIR